MPSLRTCLRDPIPEIFAAARYLDEAVWGGFIHKLLASTMTKKQIEDVALHSAEKLGERSAPAIRHVPIGPEQGQVDLALLPRMNPGARPALITTPARLPSYTRMWPALSQFHS